MSVLQGPFYRYRDREKFFQILIWLSLFIGINPLVFTLFINIYLITYWIDMLLSNIHKMINTSRSALWKLVKCGHNSVLLVFKLCNLCRKNIIFKLSFSSPDLLLTQRHFWSFWSHIFWKICLDPFLLRYCVF